MATLEQARALRALAPQGKRAPGGGKPDLVIHKATNGAAQPLGPRSFRFAISNGGVDRDRDTVALGGWDLQSYSRNPVVCLEHGRNPTVGMMPIGTASDLKVEGTELKATLTFEKADVPVIGPYAEMAVRLCKSGSLRACSVGFVPIAWETAREDWRARDDLNNDQGINFTRQELMEISICGVGSNPTTLIDPVERSFSRGAGPQARPSGASPASQRVDKAPSFDRLPAVPPPPSVPLVRMSRMELEDQRAGLDEWLAKSASLNLSIGDRIRFDMVKDRADEVYVLAMMAR